MKREELIAEISKSAKIIILIFCLICFSSPVFAKVQNLKFNKYIADEANILSESTENIINSKIQMMRNRSSAVMVVVTLNSLENQNCADVALEIGRKYKVGDKTNNGAVMLIAPNERQVRIEIGYGLEEIITDAKAGQIIDEHMLHYFKNNDYENAITQGVNALIDSVMKFYNITDESTTLQYQNDKNHILALAILLIVTMPLLCIVFMIIQCFLLLILFFVELFITRKCVTTKESKKALTKFYKELKNKHPVLYKILKYIDVMPTKRSSIGRSYGGRSRGFGGSGGFGGGGASRGW